MTGNEIRKKFLEYFAQKGHTVVESSALVPHDDPTLLFTNAGMVQFKNIFTGEEKREYVRAATSQRCVRAGGKHNDLENVGYTARHHTFFEMLGNFSFGDYFKKEAIDYGWEFLTKILGLSPEKMWISIYEEDDEAFDLWDNIEDLPEGRIVRLGEKDNFWAMGDTGPCGPCSEIHFDQGEEVGCDSPHCAVGCDCDRFLEVWNLVFMQYERSADGTMTPLPKPSIDTGMGLERIAAVIQGVHTNYDSDLFANIKNRIASTANVSYGDNDKNDTAIRVIADHSRATAFLVADGVLPSNEGRGYVLRRIIRRAVRYGRSLGLEKPFLAEIALCVVEEMSEAYPHLIGAKELLGKVVLNEEERFRETLDHGLDILHAEINRLENSGDKIIDGDFIFKLYDTFGFPVDIVRDIGLEEGFGFDEDGYNNAMDVQRQQSKRSWKGTETSELIHVARKLQDRGEGNVFVGYETRRHQSTISELVNESGEYLSEAGKGDKVVIVCQETPFYAESGGQEGDQGEIVSSAGKAKVLDTVSLAPGVIFHIAIVEEGKLEAGAEVELLVAEGRRQATVNNHSATHLLQAALTQVLGDHVKQSGSLVQPDRLRFDFTHFSPVTKEEVKDLELLVNSEIRANTEVGVEQKSRDEAVKDGAVALFGEKYGENVRVVSMGDFSQELCGGTHVRSTGEIGVMKIVSETGIAAGVRRIEAVTGNKAVLLFQQEDALLAELADTLKTSVDDLPDKIEKFLTKHKDLEKEISRLNAKLSLADIDSLVSKAQEVNGIKLIVHQATLDSAKTLREVGDRIRDKMGSGIAVLGGVLNDKVSLLTIVSKDLTDQYRAGDIVKKVAAIVGGGGGGRADMAQAGGTLVDKLPDALNKVSEIVEKLQS